MEYSVRARTRKVNRLVYSIIPRIIIYKLSSYFLPKSAKAKSLNRLHEKTAKQVVSVIIELEGLFLKVGQLISTFSTVLPKPYKEAFEQTQNHSTPKPFSEIKQRIESELKTNMDSIFLSFDETPLGTASIGQVHKAILLNGETVAVKVQHLNIEKIAALDLKLIEEILKIVQFFVKIKGMNGVFEEIVKMVHEELDYEQEAKHMQTIFENLKDDIRVIVPSIFENYSTKKVLIMEFVEGNKINDREFAARFALSQTTIAENLLDIFSKNIFWDGIYHADPHPGNILINDLGQIVLLDFGAVGTFNSQMKEGLFILMQATVFKDENMMIAGFKKMGFISNAPGINKICKKIIRLLGDYLQNEIKIEKINLNEIDINEIDISKAFELIKQIDLSELEEVVSIPRDWVLLNRTLTLIIGVTSEMAPEMDNYKVIKPNLLKMFTQKENASLIFKTSIQQQLLRLISLPRKVELFLEDIESGALEVNIKNRKHEIKLFYALAQQVVFVLASGFLYCFYRETNDVLFAYLGIGSLLLFCKSFVNGWLLKRKLK